MKQVIISIRDTKGKLVAKEYFTTLSQYIYDTDSFITNNLKDGYEIELKVGTLFRAYINETALINTAKTNNTSIKEEIEHWLSMNCYYVEQYLPRY